MSEGAKSISEVQESEEKAARLVAGATVEGGKAVREAREHAAKMISEAEEKAKANRTEAMRQAAEELEAKRKKALEKAVEESKSVRAKKLSERARSQIAKRLAGLILGA